MATIHQTQVLAEDGATALLTVTLRDDVPGASLNIYGDWHTPATLDQMAAAIQQAAAEIRGRTA